LARTLTNEKKAGELERLLAEHGKSDSESAGYRLYCGELHLLRGEVAQADRHFTAAFAKAPPQVGWQYRNGLIRARVKAEKVVATYQEVGPRRITFEELAQACLTERNAKELAALLAAHRRAEPDDLNVPRWELEVKWLNKDYEGALQLLAAHRAGLFAS